MSKKESILQAATWLFSQKGFKDTSMAELSRMTGVAEGTIFYHYKNKESLFLAALEAVKTTITSEFDKYVGETNFKSGLDMVEGVVSCYLYLAGAIEEKFLLLHRHDAYELARVNPLCRECLEAIYDCFIDAFEKAIRLGQEDGSIGDIPARKTALIIFTMVDGIVRFRTYNLYDAGALFDELIASCRRMVQSS